jgi:hypothetical protein
VNKKKRCKEAYLTINTYKYVSEPCASNTGYYITTLLITGIINAKVVKIAKA